MCPSLPTLIITQSALEIPCCRIQRCGVDFGFSLAFKFGTAVAVTADPTTYKLDVLSSEISASRKQGFQLRAIQLHGVRTNQMHRICQVDKVEAKFVRCATESVIIDLQQINEPTFDGRQRTLITLHFAEIERTRPKNQWFNQNQLAPARTK
ncbi:hypothetical protein R3P38DRAFT_2776869 [Favolaschia claudopus]|uniref:Uncharacterized protein n=1 Tax=Favolaschia claudopus TaxID=2862362 RepID=A0AAW0BNE0_9AGAR